MSGLAAKPIIDCDIVVNGADIAAAGAVLISVGFTPLGGLGVSDSWADTYVAEDGCLSMRSHLACVTRAGRMPRFGVSMTRSGKQLEATGRPTSTPTARKIPDHRDDSRRTDRV